MGLLDGVLGTSLDDPRTGAVAQLIGGLLGGRGTMEGLSSGILGYQDQMAKAKQRQMQEEQAKQAALMQQQQLMQMQRAAQQQAAQDKFRQSIPSPQMQGAQMALAGGGGPTMANAQNMQPVDPMAQFMHGAMQAGEITPMQYMQAQQKDNSPIISKAGDVARDRTGKILWQNDEKSNTPQDWLLFQLSGAQQRGIPFEQWVDARKKAGASSTSVSYGTPVSALDAKGNPVFIQPSKDGGAPAVIQGMRPPRSAAEEKADQEKLAKSRTSQQMLSTLDDAEKILKTGKATGSGLGSLVDAAGRSVGVTTSGASDAARLESMSGWLVANVPRMEGPQSNFDVQNYMTMAGKVGDRTVPIPERLAALSEVKKLQSKYSAINSGQAPVETSIDSLLQKYGGR